MYVTLDCSLYETRLNGDSQAGRLGSNMPEATAVRPVTSGVGGGRA